MVVEKPTVVPPRSLRRFDALRSGCPAASGQSTRSRAQDPACPLMGWVDGG